LGKLRKCSLGPQLNVGRLIRTVIVAIMQSLNYWNIKTSIYSRTGKDKHEYSLRVPIKNLRSFPDFE